MCMARPTSLADMAPAVGPRADGQPGFLEVMSRFIPGPNGKWARRIPAPVESQQGLSIVDPPNRSMGEGWSETTGNTADILPKPAARKTGNAPSVAISSPFAAGVTNIHESGTPPRIADARNPTPAGPPRPTRRDISTGLRMGGRLPACRPIHPGDASRSSAKLRPPIWMERRAFMATHHGAHASTNPHAAEIAGGRNCASYVIQL